LVKLRDRQKAEFAQKAPNLLTSPFFVKAVALALRKCRRSMARSTMPPGISCLHDHVNIGIAVATPAGLIVAGDS